MGVPWEPGWCLSGLNVAVEKLRNRDGIDTKQTVVTCSDAIRSIGVLKSLGFGIGGRNQAVIRVVG